MAVEPKLSMSHFAENHEISSQKISVVSDQVNIARYSGNKQNGSSNFVIDIESFRTPSSDKEVKTRILRSFSTKGFVRGSQKMSNLHNHSMDSPRGSACCPKTSMAALVAVENHVGSDHHHHVTIIPTEYRLRNQNASEKIKQWHQEKI